MFPFTLFIGLLFLGLISYIGIRRWLQVYKEIALLKTYPMPNLKFFRVGDVVYPESFGSVLGQAFFQDKLGEVVEKVDRKFNRVKVKGEWFFHKDLIPTEQLSFFKLRYLEQLCYKEKALLKTYYSEERRVEILESIDVITERFRLICEKFHLIP